MILLKEIKDRQAKERSCLYGLLSWVYSKEPTLEFLRGFRNPTFLKLLKDLGIELGEDFEYNTLETLTEELIIEYTRLFIGPGKHIYPYESAYRSEKEAGLSNTAIQIKNLVESCGLEYPSDFAGNFDHISVELEFMKKIIDEEIKAWKNKKKKKAVELIRFEKRFIDNHLSKWVPGFCDEVIRQAHLSFYRQMAKLTKEYILKEVNQNERGKGSHY